MSKNNYNAKQLKNVTILNPSTTVDSTSQNSQQDTTLENVTIVSGTINNTTIGNLFPSSATFTNATLGNITINLSTISTNNNTPITFDTNILFKNLIAQGERIVMTNTFIQPSNNYNLSTINITTPNSNVSGTLLTPSFDFFEKSIVIESLASDSSLTLNFPINTLCTSEGCRFAQSVLFSCPGQGVTFIYLNNCWFIKNSGAIVNYL